MIFFGIDFANPYLFPLYAGIFSWMMTSAGASFVFFLKKPNEKLMDASMGFAGGIMISACVFSLLLPALEIGNRVYKAVPAIVWIVFGFSLGGFFLFGVNKILPHLHILSTKNHGKESSLDKGILMVLAVILQNIPEGLSMGITFGAYIVSMGANSVGGEASLLWSAVALAIGVGIQNFPEGTSIALPLYKQGLSKKRAFFFAQFTGFVGMLSAVASIALLSFLEKLLPIALAFSAGAMMFLVFEELIPESEKNPADKHFVTLFAMFGFVLMMVLNVSLGE